MSDEVRVTIEAVPRAGLTAQQLRQAVAEHPDALAALEVADPGRLAVAFAPGLGHDPGENAPFQATVFDPVGNRAVELRGTLDRPERAELRPSAHRPQPSREELAAAAQILRADPRFPAGQDVVVYRPMPPLADLENPDGTTVRRPTLGLYTPASPPGCATASSPSTWSTAPSTGPRPGSTCACTTTASTASPRASTR